MKFKRWNNTSDDKPAPNAIWLQEAGWVAGCDAREVEVGMWMHYNGGSRREIIRVVPAGKKSIDVTVRIDTDHYGRPCEPYEWTDRRRGLVPAQFPLESAGGDLRPGEHLRKA